MYLKKYHYIHKKLGFVSNLQKRSGPIFSEKYRVREAPSYFTGGIAQMNEKHLGYFH